MNPFPPEQMNQLASERQPELWTWGARSRSRNTEKLRTGNYLDARSVRFFCLPSGESNCRELAFTQRG